MLLCLGSNGGDFMSVIFYGLILLLFVKLCQLRNDLTGNHQEEPKEGMEFLSVSEQIDTVDEIRDRLQEVENFITDVEVCNPDECVKYITLKCPTATGEREHDFMVDGENETTQKILALLYGERKELRTSLKIESQKLADRCNADCNANCKNNTISRGGECFDRR